MVGVGINPLLSLSYICPPSRTLFVFWVKWECIPLGILIRFSTFPRYKLNLPISKGYSNGQNNLFFCQQIKTILIYNFSQFNFYAYLYCRESREPKSMDLSQWPNNHNKSQTQTLYLHLKPYGIEYMSIVSYILFI